MNIHHRSGVARVGASVTLTALALSALAPAKVHHVMAIRAAASSPIYIGQIVPLTGALAATRVGRYVRGVYGGLLALREINSQGGTNGHPLELIFTDDRSTNAGAVAAFRQLIHAGHVAAIIGPGQSTEILALAPSIERAGIPTIIGGTAPKTTHEG